MSPLSLSIFLSNSLDFSFSTHFFVSLIVSNNFPSHFLFRILQATVSLSPIFLNSLIYSLNLSISLLIPIYLMSALLFCFSYQQIIPTSLPLNFPISDFVLTKTLEYPVRMCRGSSKKHTKRVWF